MKERERERERENGGFCQLRLSWSLTEGAELAATLHFSSNHQRVFPDLDVYTASIENYTK